MFRTSAESRLIKARHRPHDSGGLSRTPFYVLTTSGASRTSGSCGAYCLSRDLSYRPHYSRARVMWTGLYVAVLWLEYSQAWPVTSASKEKRNHLDSGCNTSELYQGVICSNLGQDTDYSELYRGFSQPLQATADISGNDHFLTQNCVALVRKRTIPTERQPLVGEVSANFCG
jgi:hypothetical protein